ncbi:hypothetical protein FRB96_004008, partial [Tulasnella sp. 330]
MGPFNDPQASNSLKTSGLKKLHWDGGVRYVGHVSKSLLDDNTDLVGELSFPDWATDMQRGHATGSAAVNDVAEDRFERREVAWTEDSEFVPSVVFDEVVELHDVTRNRRVLDHNLE